MSKVLLKNGYVYTKEGIGKADVLLSEDRLFLDFSENDLKNTTVYNLEGKLIVPGFVDVHVHLREPGFLYKETVESGTRAAAHGGYTAICAMPNLNPPPSTKENLSLELQAIEKDALIKVYPYGTITREQKGRGVLSDMEEIATDVIAFSDDGKGMQEEALMWEAMQKAHALGKAIVAHCEDESELKPGGCIHDGDFAKAYGYIGINSASEWKQVERDLRLSEETGAQYHICHISTKESVELLRKAKERGVKATGETGPHYLMFTDMDLEEDGSWKMNPPIRSAADREALIRGIQDGTIDCLITDHAPHSAEEKSKGLSKSSFGIVGLETAFPAMLHNMVLRNPLEKEETRVDRREAKANASEILAEGGKTVHGAISLYRLLELMCTKPREIFPIRGPKYIENGAEADIAVLDLDSVYKVDPESFYTKGRSTLFAGQEVQGRVLKTFYQGREVYDSEKGIIEASN